MIATFFGHRDTPSEIKQPLKNEIIKLINIENVDTFLIGKQGNFDIIAKNVIEELQSIYPHIKYNIVLPYLPKTYETNFDNANTIFPEELETVPKKFAIYKRNEWLVKNSDYVICYVKYSYGGAYKFKTIAEKKNKIIIEL